MIDSGVVSSNKMAVRLVRVHPNGFGDRVRRAIIDQAFAIAILRRRTGCTVRRNPSDFGELGAGHLDLR